MKTRLQTRFTRVDVAAMLAFAAVWIYYIVIVRYGMSYPDEFQFLTVTQRFVQGDRPLVDDWHLAQLPNLFLCPAYSLYVRAAGSADGIILFMRYLFAALNAVEYWILYICLRKYKWLSLAAALLFCTYIPGGLFAVYYYTASIRLLMLACLCLFSEKQTPLSLLLAGVLLSCAVIYQPGFALLYAAFTVLVFIRFLRQKKGRRFLDDFAFCLNLRAWKYISLSVFACAAALLTGLILKSGLHNILETIPYMLFTDPEYDYSAQGGAWVVVFRKLTEAVSVYGRVCACAGLIVIALSAAYAFGLFRSRREPARRILFCCACAVWIWSCVPALRLLGGSMPFPGIFFKAYPAPLLWLGLACYLLCSQKNKRFFFFWIVGLVASIGIDLTSEIALSVGAPITYIADLVFFTDLVRELRTAVPAEKSVNTNLVRNRKKSKRIDFSVRWLSRLTCGFFALWFALTLVRDNTVFPLRYLQHMPVDSFSYVCGSGPVQSIRYTKKNGEYYSKMLADIDTIKQTQPKNLFVYGMAPELYLYADLPFATFNSWIWRRETYLNRLTLYWTLHPERQPECVYVPFFEAYEDIENADFSAERFLSRIREQFDPLCTYTVQTGRGGYILSVSDWRLTPEAVG